MGRRFKTTDDVEASVMALIALPKVGDEFNARILAYEWVWRDRLAPGAERVPRALRSAEDAAESDPVRLRIAIGRLLAKADALGYVTRVRTHRGTHWYKRGRHEPGARSDLLHCTGCSRTNTLNVHWETVPKRRDTKHPVEFLTRGGGRNFELRVRVTCNNCWASRTLAFREDELGVHVFDSHLRRQDLVGSRTFARDLRKLPSAHEPSRLRDAGGVERSSEPEGTE